MIFIKKKQIKKPEHSKAMKINFLRKLSEIHNIEFFQFEFSTYEHQSVGQRSLSVLERTYYFMNLFYIRVLFSVNGFSNRPS